ILQDLAQLQKSVDEYLEHTRFSFPRLYFISEQELLDVLMCGYTRVTDIDVHIFKLMPGIASLEYRASDASFVAAIGHSGQRVILVPPVAANLGEVHKLIDVARKAKGYTPREAWVIEHGAQTLAVAQMLHWTNDVEEVLLDVGRSGARLEELVISKRGEM
ncbi:hypothetical protein T484DRAFT_1820034, partial [Baffinella frigidus]